MEVKKCMGRYYIGDIEGKFWFGIQDSDDASFFGGNERPLEKGFLEYTFNKSHISEIEQGIKNCLEMLGENKTTFDTFFENNETYSDEMLVEAGFKEEKVTELLEWYARLKLGEKIR